MAMDFDSTEVCVVLAAPDKAAILQVLGRAKRPLEGVRSGEVVCLGDAVESLMRAVEAVRRQTGVDADQAYFNYRDPGLELASPCGRKTLSGEGEIKPSDVDEAVDFARRSVGHYEKCLLDAFALSYRIDGRDVVRSPIGVCGSELEVMLSVFLTRTPHFESWKKLMERAYLAQAVPVFASRSLIHGLLPPTDRVGPHLLLELRKDFVTVVVVAEEAITGHALIMIAGQDPKEASAQLITHLDEMLSRYPMIQKAWVAGETVDSRLLEALRAYEKVVFQTVGPWNETGLGASQDAALAGLLLIAQERQARSLGHRSRNLALSGIRSKAQTFLDEYF